MSRIGFHADEDYEDEWDGPGDIGHVGQLTENPPEEYSEGPWKIITGIAAGLALSLLGFVLGCLCGAAFGILYIT